MQHPSYPTKSWFDPRLEKRTSPIHGTGVFATATIRAGERLQKVGGIVFTAEEWHAGKVVLDPSKEWNEGQIDEDLFIAMPIDDEDLSYFFNHSCDPNAWGEVARRDIAAGEEITLDYALEIFGENYVLEPCECGSPLCRHKITGNDWQRAELRERYRGHFPGFVERRIEREGF